MCCSKVEKVKFAETSFGSGGGIEFDENTFCDVCREGTCEEGNEIVFCDKCDLGVHQVMLLFYFETILANVFYINSYMTTHCLGFLTHMNSTNFEYNCITEFHLVRRQGARRA